MQTVDIGAHNAFKIQFIGSPTYLYWGMTAIDDIIFMNCDIGTLQFISFIKLFEAPFISRRDVCAHLPF